LECLALFFPVPEICRRDSLVSILRVERVKRIRRDKPCRINIGERLEHHRVDNTEDCAVGSNAQSKRDNRNHGKSGALYKNSEAVSQISEKGFPWLFPFLLGFWFLVQPLVVRVRRLGFSVLRNSVICRSINKESHRLNELLNAET